MEDSQIYGLASEILGGLTHDINQVFYAGLGGSLSIAWGEEKIFGAYASSLSTHDMPPRHQITVYDELVRQLWRDCENLCYFLRSIPEGSGIDEYYKHTFVDPATLPIFFNEEEHVRFMFAAALTWVYFHELGHLLQEHGVIRREFGRKEDDAETTTDVQDFEVSHHKPLSAHDALVSHVTELAADAEATNFYVFDLIRHLSFHKFNDQERLSYLSGTLYLMVCGVSLLFYRFNGKEPAHPVAIVEGSHPKPLTRLELLLPQIWEKLGSDLYRERGKGLDREQLVPLCTKAAFSAALYWSASVGKNREFDIRFLLKGSLSSSAILEYLQPIVQIWDEMLPRIKTVRRCQMPGGLMHFTDDFRKRITNVTVWGSGPEAKATATSSSLPDDVTP